MNDIFLCNVCCVFSTSAVFKKVLLYNINVQNSQGRFHYIASYSPAEL